MRKNSPVPRHGAVFCGRGHSWPSGAKGVTSFTAWAGRMGASCVVDVDEGIAVVAHAQLLHIGQLAQAVAGLHPLHQVVAVLRLQGIDQVHRRLVGSQDVQRGHDADVGGDHGMAAVPSQSQETDMFRSTLI